MKIRAGGMANLSGAVRRRPMAGSAARFTVRIDGGTRTGRMAWSAIGTMKGTGRAMKNAAGSMQKTIGAMARTAKTTKMAVGPLKGTAGAALRRTARESRGRAWRRAG